MEIEVGKEYLYYPVNHATHEIDCTHRYCGTVCKVLEFDTLQRCWVSFNDFPECNYRENKNRFLVDFEEVKADG